MRGSPTLVAGVERSTGRIVPETPVTLQVLDEQGEVGHAERLNFSYSELERS